MLRTMVATTAVYRQGQSHASSLVSIRVRQRRRFSVRAKAPGVAVPITVGTRRDQPRGSREPGARSHPARAVFTGLGTP